MEFSAEIKTDGKAIFKVAGIPTKYSLEAVFLSKARNCLLMRIRIGRIK